MWFMLSRLHPYQYQNYILLFFPNKLICISCILYVTFHVEWSLLGVRSLSKKGINSNNYFFIIIFWVSMFIIMHITNYMIFFPFFPKIYNVIICNKFNVKMLNKQLGLLMYLSMIDRHIISIKCKGNVFNDVTF